MRPRSRTDNIGLPPRVYFKSGSYYHVAKNVWTRLSIDKDEALRIAAGLETEDGFDLVSFLEKGFSRYKVNAKARALEFDIAVAEIIAIAQKQKWRCAVTGIKFSLRKIDGKRRKPFAPSVDRIDSAKGYIKGNVRVVCLATNLAINEWGDEIFLSQAKGATRKSKRVKVAAVLDNLSAVDNQPLQISTLHSINVST
jgi:hypothetical protein